MKQDAKYIRWFETIKIEDIPMAGNYTPHILLLYFVLSKTKTHQ
jgi:hypothetical protein